VLDLKFILGLGLLRPRKNWRIEGAWRSAETFYHTGSEYIIKRKRWWTIDKR